MAISPIRNFAKLFEFLFVCNECRSSNVNMLKRLLKKNDVKPSLYV